MSYPGNLVENAVLEIVSRRAEGDIEFGRVLEFGTTPGEQVKHYAGSARIAGISVYDPTKGYGPSRGVMERKYANKEMVGVLRKGVVKMVAGPTSGTIVAGTRLTVLKTPTVLPSMKVTMADKGSGTSPCNWGATTKVAYTAVGEWGESALLGISDSYDCGTPNATIITMPGQTACPLGTTHLRLYVSKDAGATWANWPTGNIAYGSLTAGATHTVEANGSNHAVGTTTPPTATPTLPTVGALLKATDTRDVLAVAGSEIIKGGTAGQEIWVQLNLPA